MRIGKYYLSPLMLILLAVMLVQSVQRYGSIMDWLMMTVITLPGIVIGVSFHEFAHAEAANLLGDPTAKNQGRVTINPAVHVDPIGFICLLFLGFGWGVPVPYNPYNFKNRRLGELVVSLAGVAMNFVIALIAGAVLAGLYKRGYSLNLSGGVGGIMALVVYFIMQINLVLMVFNLLPIPPLDGFGVLDALLNFRGNSRVVEFLRRNGFIVLMFLIIFNVVGLVLTPAVSGLMRFILGIFM